MKKIAIIAGMFVCSGVVAKDQTMYVDIFKTMRECEQGIQVAKELDALRDRLSKEIETEAKRLAEKEQVLKAKASTMKADALQKEQRSLEKDRRALEDKVRDGEEELKMAMQQKTETLAIEVEKTTIEVAKGKDIDTVVDVTGRVVYCKDGSKNNITADTIACMNSKGKSVAKNVAA